MEGTGIWLRLGNLRRGLTIWRGNGVTPYEASLELMCSVRNVTWMCQEGRIPGAERKTYPIVHWVIPEGFKVLPTSRNQKFVKKKPKYVMKTQKWTVL